VIRRIKEPRSLYASSFIQVMKKEVEHITENTESNFTVIDDQGPIHMHSETPQFIEFYQKLLFCPLWARLDQAGNTIEFDPDNPNAGTWGIEKPTPIDELLVTDSDDVSPSSESDPYWESDPEDNIIDI
jgi:hypothetical protein